MQLTFGLVIPAFNRADRIDNALESACDLGFEQIVVVDDGSVDGTAEVARRRAEILVVSQQNSGANSARNRGVVELETDYVTFLDSDDELLPNFLRRYRERAEAGADIMTSGFIRVHRTRDGRELVGPRDLGPAFSGYCGSFFHGGTYALRTSLFRELGGFDPQMPAAQHTEFALRMLRLARERALEVSVIDEALCLYYADEPDGIRADPARRGAGAGHLLAKHGDLISRDSVFASNLNAVAGNRSLRLGDRTAARRHFVQALRHRPTSARAWARLAFAFAPTRVRALVQRKHHSGPLARDRRPTR